MSAPKMTAKDWQERAEAMERAAHREHALAREWMERAAAAEARACHC